MVNILGRLTLAIVKLTPIRQAGLLHKWLLLKRHKSAWTTFQILPMIKKVVVRQGVTRSQTGNGLVAQLHQRPTSGVCLVLCDVRDIYNARFRINGGGEEGIRTLDTLLTYTPLAGERLRPLGHLSGADVIMSSSHRLQGILRDCPQNPPILSEILELFAIPSGFRQATP